MFTLSACIAPQFASRRRAMSGGEISTIGSGEGEKPGRPTPIPLIVALLMRALTLRPRPAFPIGRMAMMAGSRRHQSLLSPAIEETLSIAFGPSVTTAAAKCEGKLMNFRHH